MLTAHFGDFSLVSKKDHNFEATRLHFENLIKRYGNPIIILNLIKVGISTYIWKPWHAWFLFSSLKDFLPWIFFHLVFRHVRRSLGKPFCEPSLQMLLGQSIKIWGGKIAWGSFIGIWIGTQDGNFLFRFLFNDRMFFLGCYSDIIRPIIFSSKATNVLSQLGKVAAYALKLTGIFYCPVSPNLRLKGLLYYSYSE